MALKIGTLLLALSIASCTTISLTCPDGKSTLSYRGTNLLSPATTAASCTSSGSGPMASITGTDLSQLEGMVMNGLVASGQLPVPKPAPSAAPTAVAK